MRFLMLLVLTSCGGRSVTIAMTQQNNSGQNGYATLSDGNLGIEIKVFVARSAFEGTQAAHVHTGRCDNVGPVQYAIVSGPQQEGLPNHFSHDGGTTVFSQIIVGHKLSELLDQNHLINLHDARDNSLYTSCGEIN